jgi:branched-chain amino acid transport system permease protein
VLTALPEVLRFTADYRQAIYGILLLLVVLFRPQGLLGFVSIGARPAPKQPAREGAR